MDKITDSLKIERALSDKMRRHLPAVIAEFIMFTLKQGWACLFGILLLGAMIGTRAIWQADWPIARYDALFLIALLLLDGLPRFQA